MEITTTSRRYKLTPELKEQAEKRIGQAEPLFRQIRRPISFWPRRSTGTSRSSRCTRAETTWSAARRSAEMLDLDRRGWWTGWSGSSRSSTPAEGPQDDPPRARARGGGRKELPEVEPEEEFSPVVVRGHQFSVKPLSVERRHPR